MLSSIVSPHSLTVVSIVRQTVPGGKAFDMTNLASGTTVNLKGDLTFASASWAGPMFIVGGDNVVFNGGGHTLNGKCLID